MFRFSLRSLGVALAALLAFGPSSPSANDTAPEALLARTILALQNGAPDYATMTQSMADDIRPQVVILQKSLNALGAVTRIRPDEALPSGQRFIVDHIDGATRWELALDDAGRIEGLWYWNLAPKWELQRQIRALQEGKPDYTNMTTPLADAIRPQASNLQQTMINLGPVNSVTREAEETFLVQHDNGQARWRIYLDDNYKVSGLWVKPMQREQAAEPAYTQNEPAPEDDGGGFFSFLGNVIEVAAVVSDTSGRSYNDYIARNVPALRGVVELANAANAAGPSLSTATAGTGKGAVAPGSYPARPNTLDGSAACSGYSVDNYKETFQRYSNGPDVQLHSLCAGAYNYYWMYLNAIRQGYSRSESDRTYSAFQDAARVATDFHAKTRVR